MPDFDNQTLAALRGRMVRYLMRSREVGAHFFNVSEYFILTNYAQNCWLCDTDNTGQSN